MAQDIISEKKSIILFTLLFVLIFLLTTAMFLPSNLNAHKISIFVSVLILAFSNLVSLLQFDITPDQRQMKKILLSTKHRHTHYFTISYIVSDSKHRYPRSLRAISLRSVGVSRLACNIIYSQIQLILLKFWHFSIVTRAQFWHVYAQMKRQNFLIIAVLTCIFCYIERGYISLQNM